MKQSQHYLVVLPYIHTEAQGMELEFAVAGWQKHFKENHTIAIIGDYDDSVGRVLTWEREGSHIVFCQQSRVPETDWNNYRPHIDFVAKFKTARAMFPESKGFIYTCDDIYAVNDFTFGDVETLKYINGGVDFDPHSPNPFRRDKMKTKRVLSSMGFPDRNFTTHLPQWLEWDKLEALWQEYDMEHNSLVFEDLYFNLYYPVAGAEMIDEDSDRFKCAVYTTRPNPKRLKDALRTKIWITNNPDGYQPVLEDILKEHYGL